MPLELLIYHIIFSTETCLATGGIFSLIQ